ncbi:cell envelope-related transcriptional attenuator [Actinomycetales bacterium JB111]|nr:cell envelope-related transcriptional attenuator [Actinomycetales bacterium JB111]
MTTSTPDDAAAEPNDAPDRTTDDAGEGTLADDVLDLDHSGGDGEVRGGRRRRRLRGGRLALVISLGLVMVLVVGAGLVVLYVNSRIEGALERIPDPFESLTDRPAHDEGSGGTPVNILVLGSDSRISAGDPSQWQVGAQRTDAIMIVHVAGDREDATVMSFPRDSYVPIPGHGENRVNAAFSFGGPSLMIQTVEDLTGIPIDYFVLADFESFADLTDELGGVTITLPNGVEGTDRDGREVDLDPGTHLLDGEEALVYARDRMNTPGGDFGRVQRQQNWVRALMNAAISDGALSNPVRTTGLAETVAGSLAVDEDFSTTEMVRLALSGRDMRPNDVTFMTIPVVGTGWSPDRRMAIVEVDFEGLRLLSDAIAEDRAQEFLDSHPHLGDRLGPQVQ